MEYETIIGLEIHAELNTKSKMFCSNSNICSLDEEPNTRICPICMGFPGVLPVINKKAVENAILVALSLNCEIAFETKFDRKNYFYPDLPKNYQISQYNLPLSHDGFLDIEIDESERRIGIKRVHLEEDTAKLIHPKGTDYSLVDFNRSGTPLLEIVTEPQIKSPLEAKIFMQELRSILRYLKVSDADMEKGQLRCDANISLRPLDNRELGTKTEIKNLNSFKAVEKALTYEVERQKEILEKGGKVVHETRGFKDEQGITVSQRIKEEVEDYRYFPEPDLPLITIERQQTTNKQQTTNNKQQTANSINIDMIKTQLPELPAEKRRRFKEDYGLSSYDAFVLTSDLDLANFFEKTIEAIPEITESTEILKDKAKKIASWIQTELLGLLNLKIISIKDSKINPENLAELIELIDKGEISGKIAKGIFLEMFETGKKASSLISEKGIKMVEVSEIEKVIDKIIKENPRAVADYKAGKEASLKFLVGQVMRETKGQADPKTVNELLRKKLS